MDCPECKRALERSKTPSERAGAPTQGTRRLSSIAAERRADESDCSLCRRSAAMETECDVQVHPNDTQAYLAGNAFRTVGTGTPEVSVRMPGFLAKNPCMLEILRAHEKVHVENMAGPCSRFKECVDAHSGAPWYTLWLGAETISKSDWISCKNAYATELPNCQQDERAAYERTITVAQELVDEKRCADERDLIQRNISHWQRIMSCAPNCPSCGTGSSPLIAPVDVRPPAE